jgi:predicted RNase H-like HicB family nuclease
MSNVKYGETYEEAVTESKEVIELLSEIDRNMGL